ncbi:crotonase/enoyl-CoA hydratase family protein [Burkholderia lata]|uniref:Short chain enoyl-CoA hydratase n=1 Tax=Burkholderia lata (strain ATCC 17760 / DSM 23089 / LMG 22485 / NCIMB 9086 / R18194 / 383) TaxID=482957 RepID=Q39N06_BURL3|nr:crotonase/enoyl-CoA hydratase family protein [Burkholderia lata]ABB06160.1 short chain enoyl-CoA hydratase [Burkholderia lata]
MSDELLVEYRNGIQILTINRLEARNACTKAIAEAIAAELDTLERRDDLRAAIITGAGGAFCSGMDLKGFLKGERPSIPGRGFAGITEAPPGKPLIAAVEGYALAGGFEVVLASDLVVASETARFGLPETKRGLVAAAGGLLRIQHQLPERIALELVLTGDMLDAKRAFEYGLVNRLTPPGDALAVAIELAGKIAANGPLAVAASKRVMRASRDWSTAEMFVRQREITDPVFASRDAREGAAAFAEKRVPQWEGR